MRAPCLRGVLSRFGAVVLVATVGLIALGAPSRAAARVASAAAGPAPGTVFIADTVNNDVLEVPPGGGPQTTIGSGLASPFGLALDQAGDLYIADLAHNRVVLVPAAGGAQITVGTGLQSPLGVAVDAAGNVYIADYGHDRVVKVPPGGVSQTTVGTGLQRPTGVAVDWAGNVFIADTGNARVVKVPADGGAQSTVGSGPLDPQGVAVDVAGNVFIADSGNSRVVKVPADGGAQTTVGTGLNNPIAVAVDAAGDVYIADFDGRQVVRVPAGGGAQTTVGTSFFKPAGVAVYAPAPTFSADTPPGTAPIDATYSYTYVAATPTGEPPAVFALAEGTLPPGLTLNPSTGVLSGTPSTAGSYTFRVMTANAVNATLGPPTTITVKAPQLIRFTSTPPDPAVVGGTYQVTATGGGSGNPVSLSISADSTEGACAVDSAGLVQFTGAGTCIINAFQAGDATHDPGSGRQTITVVTAPPPQTAAPAGITGSGGGELAITGTNAVYLIAWAVALVMVGVAVLLVATAQRERPRRMSSSERLRR